MADMFGLNDWLPTGGARDHTRAEFEALRGAGGRIDWAQLSALIPANCTNLFQFEPRTQRGFKFEWSDPTAGNWHVHGHEPDAGAAAGHAGAAGWVVRISHNGDWLLSTTYDMVVPGTGTVPTDWSRSRSANVARLSHIPFTP
nr:polymorphic toxin type 30 domain-containing protein [Azospirillum cavernae]